MSILNVDGSIRDPYQNFIASSRYARWSDDLLRRETWTESVDRYMDFMTEHLYDKYAYVPDDSLTLEISEAIMNLDIVPSMRALMTAGEAATISNVAIFNCAYVPVDDLAAFSEALFILMNGTGVGYSVESRYVDKLPPVAEITESGPTIVVGDSKLGWATAYKILLESIWLRGILPGYDLSSIRPAGARLKTFGGRASGPDPLDELFSYTISTLAAASGRKLRPIEVHDLMCKIASVVVVGGVRRSAMISLSDLADQEMAKAKTGEWWEIAPHRALANISAVYEGETSPEAFNREWENLMASGSGERGIFNRTAAQKQAARNGLRDQNVEYGVNPCLSYGTRMLTSNGLQKIGDLAKSGATFKVYNGNGDYTDSYAWKTGTKLVYRVSLSNGQQIDLTDNHVIEVMEKMYPSSDTFTKPVECSVGELKIGDKIRPFVADAWSDGAYVDPKLTTAIGILFGDGYFHKASGNEVFIGTREDEVLNHLSMFFNVESSGNENNYRVRGAGAIMQEYGFEAVTIPDRNIPDVVFTWSADAVRGFLKGLFSANGGAMPKHNRIDLKSVNLTMLRDVQMLLSALGFNSYITTNKPQMIEWPNGTYESRESYDLNIAGGLQYTLFQEEIGFVHAHKSLPGTGNLSLIRHPRCVEVVSVDEIGEQDVFDFHEAVTHWGWANGIKVHNCSEILLRPKSFCNLTEVIIREEDGTHDLARKVRLATILGTWQSTLTDFPFLRPEWTKNAEEERLLGVSQTGIFGNALTATAGKDRDRLQERLNKVARDANTHEALCIGIPPSDAITTVKPSGTVSQLAAVSSGIHPWYAQYYIRTIRADKKDPLAQLMVDAGVPCEPDVTQPDTTLVFSFPIKAPDGAVTRNDLSAIEHLEHWLAYKVFWCDHTPSVTISVRPEEWTAVHDWVWAHLDEITGVSFLPYSEHTYQQAPYQEISATEWRAMALSFPAVRWADLSFYELGDQTTGSATLACSAAGCDSADLVPA